MEDIYEREIKIADLAAFLYEANQKYRIGEPIVSDKEYDDKVEELKILCPNHSFFEEGIHTVLDEGFARARQENLPIEMRSLDKVKTIDEIKKWLESKNLSLDTDLIITPKYDGISVLCDEESGTYWTSGDGFVGQNITEHMKHCIVSNASKDMSGRDYYSIGELIISKQNWDLNFKGQLNPRSKKPFKSARNTVAGMMNTDNVEQISTFLSNFHFIPYMLIGKEKNTVENRLDKEKQLEYLYRDCFLEEFCPSEKRKAFEITEGFLDLMFKRWSKDFVIDGLVIDINDVEIRKRLGYEANANPAFARAYKDPKWSETAQTKITNIKIQISKRGTATPVLEIEPVDISGATISNVNGINAQYIMEWMLGKDQEITILRSGEVIPKIIEVQGFKIPFREDFKTISAYKEAYDIALRECQLFQSSFYDRYRKIHKSIQDKLSHCPFCGSPLVWSESNVDRVCSNSDCPERLKQQALFFFETMEVRDVGEKTVELFLKKYTSVKEILNMSISDILSCEGFQSQSASKLWRSFQKLERMGYDFSKLSYALGWFEDLGEKTVQLILDKLGITNLHDLINFKQSKNTIEQLCQIEGIGVINANKFVKNLSFAIDEISNSKWLVNSYAKSIETMIGPLNGYVFVFSQFRDKPMAEKIRLLGGTVLESYNKTVTHLVVIDLSKKTSKVLKAEKDGKIIITKQDIANMINELKK